VVVQYVALQGSRAWSICRCDIAVYAMRCNGDEVFASFLDQVWKIFNVHSFLCYTCSDLCLLSLRYSCCLCLSSCCAAYAGIVCGVLSM